MALPLSCASTSFCKLTVGPLEANHTGVPKGILPGSTAMERPGVNDTPCAPLGPEATSGPDSGSSLKNTIRGLLHSNSLTRPGCCAAQALMAGHDASRTAPWSINQRPTLLYGCSF